MRKHRTKIIFAAVAICLLAAAWGFGGEYANRGAEAETSDAPASAHRADESGASASRSEDIAPAEVSEETAPEGAGDSAPIAENAASAEEAAPASVEFEIAEAPAESAAQETASATDAPPAQRIDPETGKDKYLTDPVPEGKPLPVEPRDAQRGEVAFTATLTVRCDTILGNMEFLDKEKWELVPEDGVILKTTEVTFYEGESVFNVLQREMKRAKLHMEFVNTPIYNSAYIEGIGNLYEFDAGELSGWMYKVNGRYPNYGCSRYSLADGDAIEWHYTCDLGRDLGAEWLGDRMPQRDA
ncbi:MAG: DUF4430 domain-containing protein [Clostridiales Family XIII bacterium]|jgi:hypothetical protein|nr:DUF4430 domain-containing protein [Clostridiales Family XIII bacterium]